ncbi:hypothetical protein P4E94_18655 [Pontiellaceae bacterium B12219]|nr:hypothetical protein [Pontiellaceae bacterium B12219]
MVMGNVVIDEGELSMVVTNSGLGHNYQLKFTDDLTVPNWQNATGVLEGNGGALQIMVPVGALDTNLFYKLEAWRR